MCNRLVVFRNVAVLSGRMQYKLVAVLIFSDKKWQYISPEIVRRWSYQLLLVLTVGVEHK